MPITHPLLMPRTGIGDSSFDLENFAGLSASRSGDVARIEFAPPRWRLRLTTRILGPAEMRVWREFIDAQEDGAQSFFGFDPRRARPLAYPTGVAVPGNWNGTGAFLGAATPANPARRLTLAGLPSGYVLSSGDYIVFTSGAARACHRALETVTVGGNGQAIVDVRPAVTLAAPSGAGQGVVVALFGAVCEMKMIPGSSAEPQTTGNGVFSFEAIEVQA